MNNKELVDILLDFKGDKVIEYCRDELRRGASPYEIFNNLSEGLDEIGKKYESGRYFTSDLIVSGGNMKKAIAELKPLLKQESNKSEGRVLVGTVKGDVHDIGKTIFSIMLQSRGFEVKDLGVDVNENEFIKGVKEFNPDILAMSSLLTSTKSNMESVINELTSKGLRNDLKIIIGGIPVDEEYASNIGADAYGKDAVEGVRKCITLLRVD